MAETVKSELPSLWRSMNEPRACRHLYQICPQTKGRFERKVLCALVDRCERGARARDFRLCANFRTPAVTRPSTRSGGRRLKSAKARNRGKWAPSVPRALWRFSRGVGLGDVGSKAPARNRFIGGIETIGRRTTTTIPIIFLGGADPAAGNSRQGYRVRHAHRASPARCARW